MAETMHRLRVRDGLRLAVFDKPAQNDNGRAAVLCLPGLTRNARDFEFLLPHLARHHRVLRLDFRGRGQSDWDANPLRYRPDIYARDVIDVIDALEIAQVKIIGTSLGGLVGMILAATFPHRVVRLLLNDIGAVIEPEGLARIGTYVSGQSFDNWDDAIAFQARMNAAIYPDFTLADWQMLTKRLYRVNYDSRIVPDYDTALGDAWKKAADSADKTVAAPDMWPLFKAIHPAMPMAVLRGANSDILSARTVAEMRHHRPNMVHVDIANRGHAPLMDEPEAIDALEKWLALPR